MTRMAWGNTGERFFETGVDRGVLYIAGIPGVPWNGLTAVNESPTGGDAVPYYIDGYKYANVSAAEEFEATIEALSHPAEFARCDGTAEVSNGLFVTQQPRVAFGFSYRTKIGNDVEGIDHGYKIHLVYNALAAPTSRSLSSIADSSDPAAFSWSISTQSPLLSGYKPTAHMIVDSRRAHPFLLSYLEDILYGTDNSAPRMPEASELIALFQLQLPPVDGEVRLLGVGDNTQHDVKNLAQRPIGPRATTDDGWRISSSETMTFVNDGDPAIEALDPVGRGAIYIDPNLSFTELSGVGAGKWFGVGIEVEPLDYWSTQSNMALRIAPYNGAATNASGGATSTKYIPIPPGEYTRIQHAAGITAFTPDSSYIRGLVWPGQDPNAAKDPKMLNPSGWTIYGSTSFGAAGTGMDGTTEGSLFIPGDAAQIGAYSSILGRPGLEAGGIPVLPGEKINVSAYVRSANAILAGRASIYVRFYDLNDVSNWVQLTSISNPADITANVWTQVSGTFEAPATSVGQLVAVIGLYKQTAHTSAVRWSTLQVDRQSRFRIKKAVYVCTNSESAALDLTSSFWDGDTSSFFALKQEMFPYWESTPGNSPTIAKFYDFLRNVTANIGDGYIVDGLLWVFANDGYWHRVGALPPLT